MNSYQPTAKVSVPLTNDFCPQTLFLYGTYQADGRPDFGLFCWISYLRDSELGVMACIGGSKLTKDRIKATGVFSANLVTEALLPLADYLGNKPGYDADKMQIAAAVSQGAVLPVPVLVESPVTFELEVQQSVPLDGGEVFFCKIRNVLHSRALTDADKAPGQLLAEIKPARTTCQTYFGWDGRALGLWGEPQKTLER